MRRASAALMACASVALFAQVAPAHAVQAGSPADLRPVTRSEPTQPGVQRTMRPRATVTASRSKAAVAGKPTPAASDLAGKVKGPLQIIISLDKQQLTLYSGDDVIAHSRVSTGQAGRSTPTGVFSIIQKDRWHRSNLYDDAPMWFMQRITWSGVALHQGIVPNYPASHGCIRLPEAFARQLWTTTKLGARVIIARGEVVPVAISHPSLFAPRQEPAAPAMSQADALKAVEQAWTFAQLASKSPLTGMTVTDLPTPGVPAIEPPKANTPANTRPLKPGPVSVFISRKEGKLYVRKGFEPVFDTPVAIAEPNAPLGTHVFTAIAAGADNGALRWTVVTMPKAPAGAAAALDRISIPQAAVDRISELVSVGASLIVSDQGLGSETGVGTDFIVLTR
ncbi:MAG: hypothetical protein QOI12_3365 [Alphaproteobacteria bacterium]|jgi:lipoprotein-anchoring transpeptidase ErfK/SrfK|nr:hypothetical protein [Alphaproteobacteria bacterium]